MPKSSPPPSSPSRREEQDLNDRQVLNHQRSLSRSSSEVRSPFFLTFLHPLTSFPLRRSDGTNSRATCQVRLSSCPSLMMPSSPYLFHSSQALTTTSGAVPVSHAPTTLLSQSLIRRREARQVKPDYHAQWKLKRVISGHLGWVRAIAVEPGNKWFATGAGDRVIKVRSLPSVVLVGRVLTLLRGRARFGISHLAS